MIDHTPDIEADEISMPEQEAYLAFRTANGISRFTKLERASFIHGYRAARNANTQVVDDIVVTFQVDQKQAMRISESLLAGPVHLKGRLE